MRFRFPRVPKPGDRKGWLTGFGTWIAVLSLGWTLTAWAKAETVDKPVTALDTRITKLELADRDGLKDTGTMRERLGRMEQKLDDLTDLVKSLRRPR